MPKGTSKVRVDRVEISDLTFEDEWRFVEIDSDGDLYLTDGTSESAYRLLIRKHMVPAIIKALRLAASLSA